jgi:TonB family protein
MRKGLVAIAVLLLGATGGGQELPRSGVISPRVKTTVKAVYTPEAKAAGIEGTVLVEALVMPDGIVDLDVRVVRSLDTRFGLDEQAVNASKQWTFHPATRHGKPVAFSVTIEHTFRLNSK